MSERPPFMPMYWGDYFGDTKHLTTIQHGAYLLLIGHYWRKGKLPDDDRALAAIVGMQVNVWRRWHREVIITFFEDGWRHPRIEAELAKARDLSEKRREAVGKRRDRGPTIVDTRARATPQPHPHSQEKDFASVEAEASTEGAPAPAGAAKARPANIRVWQEGIPILRALDVKESRARGCIGRWLRDTGGDHDRVLEAIERARDRAIGDPVPWINAALKPSRPHHDAQTDRSVVAACDRLLARIRANKPDATGNGSDESAAVIRLLPQGRGK